MVKGQFYRGDGFSDTNDIIPDHGMYKDIFLLFLVMGCVLACFYYHDKNIIAGAAYETAVTGSTKVREKDGISESELNALFKERVGRKCILFSRIRVQSSVGKDEIKVQAAARRKKIAISVESRAAVTEPEKYIRDIRRIKK